MSAGQDNSRPTNSAVKGGVGNEFLDRGANRILNTQRRLTVRKTINIGKQISVQGEIGGGSRRSRDRKCVVSTVFHPLIITVSGCQDSPRSGVVVGRIIEVHC